MGFVHAGFEHLYGVDNWDIAVEAYEKNIGRCINKDIEKFTGKEGECHILIGSPPCQTFSKANINTRDLDLSLTYEFLRIVDEIKPKAWIMENVPDVYKLVKAPYKYIIDMEDYGLLQRRSRFFASNIPLKLEKEEEKYLTDEKIGKQVDFRGEVVFRKYPTITGRYNSFVKSSVKFRDSRGIKECNHTEALLIQGFPFYTYIPNTTQRNKEQLIGNAVPPLIAYKIAQSVRKTAVVPTTLEIWN